MQKENGSEKEVNTRKVRCLLCDGSTQSELRFEDGVLVQSPIQCLEKAVEENPDLIVVRFTEMELKERKTLVELCAALKRNSHTRNTPVVALLHNKHRKLLDDLAGAGVDYVKFIAETVNLTRSHEIVHKLGPDDHVSLLLEVLCPYLDYDTIDARNELTVCGAHLDRMVLGGSWLHEVCQTRSHLECKYFLNPRQK